MSTRVPPASVGSWGLHQQLQMRAAGLLLPETKEEAQEIQEDQENQEAGPR